MRPRRVAVVITRLEGGAGVLAARGARCLDPNEYEVTLISGTGERLFDTTREAGVEALREPRLRRPVQPLDDLRAMRRLRSFFRRREFDIVHTHCAKAGAVGRLAAYHAGVPRIVHTYHGFPFHEFQRPWRRAAYVAVERRLGRITDRALCVGTGVAVEAIRRELLAPQRVRTMDVAVDLDAPVRTPHSRQRARELLGLAPDSTVVGTAGRLVYQKAPEDFVAAVQAQRSAVQGVWIGAGDRIPARHQRVRFVGARVDVTELLPAFDVFVLASRYEGMPLAAVEAMVCGVPVVATAVNSVADAVQPGRTGLLVPPGRPDLLAEAIRYALESPAASEMAATARAWAGQRYGLNSLAEALAVAYSG